MSKDNRPIEIGDRFETEDDRDAGRVVEVIEVVSGPRYAGDPKGSIFRTVTEASPKNPQAVGNVQRVSERTLRGKYVRVSR
ncbi:hypothetical protein DEU34_2239 [Microbacterium sp. AG1240]|uniref:hypothetical protein n=1 Tax=Microbacterium sp. AG1240 TaxID=2183992 RepID=UPI000EB28301|nr:hypothetical protein [Microbacterium sp. AG1240]RKT33636.1 hypothetical protein DEU34_2239 [Microbacterium sp. AG1240]